MCLESRVGGMMIGASCLSSGSGLPKAIIRCLSFGFGISRSLIPSSNCTCLKSLYQFIVHTPIIYLRGVGFISNKSSLLEWFSILCLILPGGMISNRQPKIFRTPKLGLFSGIFHQIIIMIHDVGSYHEL